MSSAPEHPSETATERFASRRTLNVLWSQNHLMVLGYIRSVVIDFHMADDVLQETAAAVAERFDDYDSSRPFLPWALGIARNKVLVTLRANSRDRCVFDHELVTQLSETYAELETSNNDVQEALSDCVTHLHRRARKLLELRYVRDLPANAIAQATGTTAGAAGMALHRIRKVLRDCVQSKLGTAMQGGD
ncbi:sigma-70 family RNA polymerase sigma factor [Aeoliella sp. ICT_H6.2]|uniref:Sigma-70 family RNA polymerase sigma factor n=1 Tax=Aeoliella straminimaris TaxID=2954799 RepID=A0A9X2FG88_9BACT|nr:sigma-70 family RNA polymerase sigma factor [Aeoliella straminimaris]MCO6047778.1 sigma-70 family RNA polymerase sigma factor [Aeoliella straminimaris]